MSVLTDLQEAVAAQDAAIVALSARIDALPTDGVDGGEVAAVTELVKANTAKIDALVPPAA